MKKFLCLLLFCASANLIHAQCADSANIYKFTFNGKKYEIVKEKKTWTEAASCAVERGGYLLEINNVNEQNAVYDTLINGAGVSSTYVTIANGGGIAYVWIGANDRNTEGVWVWDGNNDGTGTHFWTGEGFAGDGNGTAVANSYVNWGGKAKGGCNEPDDYNNDQDCAAIGLAGWPSGTTMLGSAGEWNDIICSSAIYYVIEYAATGNIENGSKNRLNIYPNPVSEILYLTENYSGLITLTDIQGRNLFVGQDVLSINVSDFPAGFYLLKAESREKVIIEKVIIQR